MSHDTHCLSCGIATIRSTSRNKEPHLAASKPDEYAFLDIQQPLVTTGLTPATSHPYYLFVIDAFSRFSRLYGLANKSSKAVVKALKKYSADGISRSYFEYINLECIRADAGSQFTSSEFRKFCTDHGIQLSLAAPKKQNQNHLAERSW